jgi:hypothetical protein
MAEVREFDKEVVQEEVEFVFQPLRDRHHDSIIQHTSLSQPRLHDWGVGSVREVRDKDRRLVSLLHTVIKKAQSNTVANLASMIAREYGKKFDYPPPRCDEFFAEILVEYAKMFLGIAEPARAVQEVIARATKEPLLKCEKPLRRAVFNLASLEIVRKAKAKWHDNLLAALYFKFTPGDLEVVKFAKELLKSWSNGPRNAIQVAAAFYVSAVTHDHKVYQYDITNMINASEASLRQRVYRELKSVVYQCPNGHEVWSGLSYNISSSPRGLPTPTEVTSFIAPKCPTCRVMLGKPIKWEIKDRKVIVTLDKE